MTRETVNQFKEKLVMIALPLMVALLAWLVVGNYENKSSWKVVEAKQENQDKYLEKMYTTIQENNVILYSKADQVQNETDHTMLMIKLNDITSALRSQGLKVNTSEYSSLDTIIGGKPISFLHAVIEPDTN